MNRLGAVLLLLLSLPSVAAEDAPRRVVELKLGAPAPALGCFIREPDCINIAKELARKPEVVEVQTGMSATGVAVVGALSFAAGVVLAAKLL